MIRAVVGVLYSFDSTKVLMLKRKDKDRTAAGWCFPGGKRDGVEDLKETLIREFKEETNLDVCPTNIILCADSGKYRIYIYEVVLKGSSPKVITISKEHVDEAWVAPTCAIDEFTLAGPVTERILNLIIKQTRQKNGK